MSDINCTLFELYKLYFSIATMKKAVVSFMGGVNVGATACISQMSAFKIATENSTFSMSQSPHSRFASIANIFALSRLDGHIGAYLLLTGHELKAEELMFAGLATHFVTSAQLDDVEAKLSTLDNFFLDHIDTAIQEVAAENNDNTFAQNNNNTDFWEKSKIIQRCFQYNTMEQIFEALEQDDSSFAKTCLESMKNLSPTSLKVSLAALRLAPNKTMGRCLDYEYRACRTLPLSADYQEEVRARFEKRSPEWNPETLEEVYNHESKYLSPVDFAPEHALDVDFIRSLYQRYTIPSSNEIRRVLFKQKLGSKDEVVNWFLRDRNNKFGVKEKVEYVIDSGIVEIDMNPSVHTISRL